MCLCALLAPPGLVEPMGRRSLSQRRRDVQRVINHRLACLAAAPSEVFAGTLLDFAAAPPEDCADTLLDLAAVRPKDSAGTLLDLAAAPQHRAAPEDTRQQRIPGSAVVVAA